jgi:hypothetical protein
VASDSRSGADWSPEELKLIVDDYFSMLRDEQAGRPYSKTQHRRALMEQIDRSDGSIEFKHRNISAVLIELGFPRVEGYKPAWNDPSPWKDSSASSIQQPAISSIARSAVRARSASSNLNDARSLHSNGRTSPGK